MTRTSMQLQETIYFQNFQEGQIDPTAHTIRGVKILGLISKNNREYTPAALKRAVPLYEGKCVNVDHSDPSQKRSYKDRFGVLRNVVFREDGLYGDLCYNPNHSLAEQFVWDAINAPNNVGLSQDAKGTTVMKGKKRLVESIELVRSVDIVADPASVSGLFESTSPEGTASMDISSLTLDELRTARPDLLESLQESLNQTEAAKSRDKELATLREQVASFRQAQALAAKRETILAELREAKLDPANELHVSPVFLTSLLEAKDPDRKALIQDRQRLVEGVRPTAPIQSASRFTTRAALGAGSTPADRIKSWTR